MDKMICVPGKIAKEGDLIATSAQAEEVLFESKTTVPYGIAV